MDIFELSDMIGTAVRIEFMQTWLDIDHCKPNIWLCELKGCGIGKEGAGLLSSHGLGQTPQGALNDYCKKISGKTVVYQTREYEVPKVTGSLNALSPPVR